MASSPIASRIADFLKGFPPFSEMTLLDLKKLGRSTTVFYFNRDETVFNQGEDKSDFLYVVCEGKVNLERSNGLQTALVDVCDAGDLFGVRAMLTGNPYVFTARCDEDSLVYGLPVADFMEITAQNNEVALFLASGLAGGKITVTQPKDSKPLKSFSNSESLLNWNQPLEEPRKNLLYVLPGESLRVVAMKMTEHKTGSAVIVDENTSQPLGIITDRDFRNKVVARELPIDSPVSQVMSDGVISLPLGLPVSKYFLQMLRSRVRHICLTKNNSLVGVISETDLMSVHQSHPYSLAFLIEEARTVEELVKYRDQADLLIKRYVEDNVSMNLICQLVSHINDETTRRAIYFAMEEMTSEKGDPPVSFAWINLGSEGRMEQVLRTDQDNALIFQDVPENERSDVQDYFVSLSKKANSILLACGFELCPANMMAGNPQWCQPLSQWKTFFSKWIGQPEENALMLSTIFFDFRFIWGDPDLTKELKEHVDQAVLKDRIFLNFLAKNALKNPAPLSFFKNFLMERTGEHKNEFDLKARAMMPLVDMARVLTLDARFFENPGTLARYEFLAEKEPKNKELFLSAAKSYQYMLKYRALFGFKNEDSGRFIPIENLSKLDRQMLRNAFEPVYELQQLLEVRYQLNYFRT